MNTSSKQRLSFQARRSHFSHNIAATTLIDTIVTKETNLCVSADLTKSSEILALADAVGPFICMLKTHVDIIEDFSDSFVSGLQSLAKKHNFVIFEDRKFADIGNTVQLQYSSGVHRIASWSHFTNAHPLPGEGIVTGLKAVGKPLGRALLLLAQMSSAGSLFTAEYTSQAVAMAEKHRDFVVGFIAQKRLSSPHDFLVLTPGVNLAEAGDDMGQQYRTPKTVMADGCDVIIVGRGIYAPGRDPAVEAKRYRDAGWGAYLDSLA
ncbi:orotidine-5'-phosphate decarboxylase [Catenaria anguillulae PL171]|uniref:Orotidine 5'-phosphate decarboxylase n=1 Tax=Catenaria anguillulae PL171 TaxID=765915 RepID=A0A1Y2I3W0_9FUNG|nr:orotidine-5'-phosphate decarboxylase [Catenaria anguillulae PL171]